MARLSSWEILGIVVGLTGGPPTLFKIAKWGYKRHQKRSRRSQRQPDEENQLDRTRPQVHTTAIEMNDQPPTANEPELNTVPDLIPHSDTAPVNDTETTGSDA
ncbi:hypothetical protein TWF694_010129 [Orbilia ellipsospora]|uniref:Uncharacterized protein n=1 Tax=Orbilia ellipsospora TaxID=2528407 RepID=A0AAV9X902_9PEZI